ncbi:CHAT domain protein [Mycobacteroides salmoniphilum]|nr:CHAT domain protein [Mycobacteroides salmoniphilum]
MKKTLSRYGIHHHPSVDPLTEAFVRGRRRRIVGNVRTESAQMSAQSAYNEAAALLRGATGNDDLIAAAEKLGYAHVIATLADQRDEALNVLGLLGQAYRGWSGRSRDAVLQASYDQLRVVADAYKRRGELRSSAIYETNAATALLEKHTITGEDLKHVRECLDYSRIHKSAGSVDWAYTEFSTGIYYSKMPAATPADYVENLRQAKDHFDTALELFSKYGEPLSAVVLGEYAHLLATQVDADCDKRVAEAVLANLDDLPAEIVEHAAKNPVMFGHAIHSNPASMGFVETPPWVAEAIDADLDAETASSLRAATARTLEKLSQPVNTDRAGLQHTRWWLARVRWELDKSASNLDLLFDAAATLQNEPDPVKFIACAVFACWSGKVHLDTTPRPALLHAITAAYLKVIEHRTNDTEVASFIKQYDHQIRFIACSLADQGLWDDSVAVLEATRVLIYRAHSTSRTAEDSSDASTVSWVYVTHSPEASYVIVARDGEPTRGQALTTMSGNHLTTSTLSVIQGQIGLLSTQWSYMTTALTDAVERIVSVLQPITDAITSMAHEQDGLILIPSGLYTGLPLAAAVSEQAPNHYPFIATAPARHIVDTRPYTWHLRESSVYAFSAARPPGWSPLRYSTLESHAIVASAPAHSTRAFDDITRAEFLSASNNCDVLHFSGHSYSDTEQPLQSALVLHDGELTLDDLVATPRPHLNMVTLSSCQSSTPAISGLSSEALGLHSAFHYAGCPYVIGSLWPVYDITAAVFMTRFYAELGATEIIELSVISSAVRNTQQWMKTASRIEISAFLAGLTPPIALSDRLANLPAGTVPFAEPRNWAAFYVGATRL